MCFTTKAHEEVWMDRGMDECIEMCVCSVCLLITKSIIDTIVIHYLQKFSVLLGQVFIYFFAVIGTFFYYCIMKIMRIEMCISNF